MKYPHHMSPSQLVALSEMAITDYCEGIQHPSQEPPPLYRSHSAQRARGSLPLFQKKGGEASLALTFLKADISSSWNSACYHQC